MDQSYQKASLEKNQNTPDQQDGGGTGREEPVKIQKIRENMIIVNLQSNLFPHRNR
jgi:hypothetical protein